MQIKSWRSQMGVGAGAQQGIFIILRSNGTLALCMPMRICMRRYSAVRAHRHIWPECPRPVYKRMWHLGEGARMWTPRIMPHNNNRRTKRDPQIKGAVAWACVHGACNCARRFHFAKPTAENSKAEGPIGGRPAGVSRRQNGLCCACFIKLPGKPQMRRVGWVCVNVTFNGKP